MRKKWRDQRNFKRSRSVRPLLFSREPSFVVEIYSNAEPRPAVVGRSNCVDLCSVDLKPGDCELVVDEGRALQPCRYRWCTHMSCIIIYPYSTYPCRGYFHTQ